MLLFSLVIHLLHILDIKWVYIGVSMSISICSSIFHVIDNERNYKMNFRSSNSMHIQYIPQTTYDKINAIS